MDILSVVSITDPSEEMLQVKPRPTLHNRQFASIDDVEHYLPRFNSILVCIEFVLDLVSPGKQNIAAFVCQYVEPFIQLHAVATHDNSIK